jgi:TonB family protein
MGDDSDAQLATCLESRFGWSRATLFSVPAECQPVEVRVVSTPRDKKELALLSLVADSIARRLREEWSVSDAEHGDTTRITWSVNKDAEIAGVRRLGTSPVVAGDEGRLERLVRRVGGIPMSMRFRDEGWNPFQLVAQFNAPCLSRAEPRSRSDGDTPYFEFQVEKQASPTANSPQPKYPQMLWDANVEGEVLAQFVVDTSGHVEMGTFKVLKSSHELFTRAVRNVLPDMRFDPAVINGRKVRQVVRKPFVFAR